MQMVMPQDLKNLILLYERSPNYPYQQQRSIIAIAVGYPNKLKGAPKSVRGDRRGLFARASWGQDYHTIMRKRLDMLAAFIES